jgi:hypothetical protein
MQCFICVAIDIILQEESIVPSSSNRFQKFLRKKEAKIRKKEDQCALLFCKCHFEMQVDAREKKKMEEAGTSAKSNTDAKPNVNTSLLYW